MAEKKTAVFDFLNGLNVNGHTEKKNVGNRDLTYLSWPWAWAEVKRHYPDAHYTIWRNEHGLPYTADPATGYMVYTSVTIEGITHEMWLPVMDGANRAMKQEGYDYQVKNPNFKWAKWDATKKGYYDKYGNEQPEYFTKHCDAASMMDINKTVMRCLVKNLAMFGLGLYIYAGEDLPETENQLPDVPEEKVPPKSTSTTSATVPAPKPAELTPEMAFLNNELEFIANERNTNKDSIKASYAVTVKAMVKEGKIPNKKMAEYSKDEIISILDYMKQNMVKSA